MGSPSKCISCYFKAVFTQRWDFLFLCGYILGQSFCYSGFHLPLFRDLGQSYTVLVLPQSFESQQSDIYCLAMMEDYRANRRRRQKAGQRVYETD